MFLLRGNHETAAISRIYGFFDECRRRYSQSLWKSFGEVFNCMPFSALVEGRIFCMHGGLSQDLKCWDQLLRIKRPCEVPDTGILCDLLWADPEKGISEFSSSHRGVSYVFGADAVRRFCKEMDIDLVARAHQVVRDGSAICSSTYQLLSDC